MNYRCVSGPEGPCWWLKKDCMGVDCEASSSVSEYEGMRECPCYGASAETAQAAEKKALGVRATPDPILTALGEGWAEVSSGLWVHSDTGTEVRRTKDGFQATLNLQFTCPFASSTPKQALRFLAEAVERDIQSAALFRVDRAFPAAKTARRMRDQNRKGRR